MSPFAHRPHFGLAAVLVLSACNVERPTDSRFTVRDSVGITIVESFEPAWGEGEGWVLSSQPILDIGVLDGDPDYQLYDVADVTRTDAGDFVVANRGTQQVRVYDSTGQFVRAFGRAGRGPGEFSSLTLVQSRPADTILAFDLEQQRVTAVDGSGRVLHSSALEMGTNWVTLGSFDDDGSLVWADVSFAEAMVQAEEHPGTIARADAALVRYPADGQPTDTIGLFPGSEISRIQFPGGNSGFALPKFGRQLTHAVGGGRVYVGPGDDYEILAFDMNGSLFRVVRWSGPDLQVTETTEDSLLARWMEANETAKDPASRRRLEERFAAIPSSPRRPPFGGFLLDPLGCLWVLPFEMSGPTYAPDARLAIFDAESRWLGSMTVPDGFRVFEVGEDYVLGVATDELDVEHVRMYGLTR